MCEYFVYKLVIFYQFLTDIFPISQTFFSTMFHWIFRWIFFALSLLKQKEQLVKRTCIWWINYSWLDLCILFYHHYDYFTESLCKCKQFKRNWCTQSCRCPTPRIVVFEEFQLDSLGLSRCDDSGRQSMISRAQFVIDIKQNNLYTLPLYGMCPEVWEWVSVIQNRCMYTLSSGAGIWRATDSSEASKRTSEQAWHQLLNANDTDELPCVVLFCCPSRLLLHTHTQWPVKSF